MKSSPRTPAALSWSLSNSPSESATHIGFIGIGNMGSRMAGRLLDRGFPLTVYDCRPEAARELVARGADAAGSPADLAQRSGVICMCVPGPPEFEACVYGAGGVLEGIRAGAVVVDHTTNSPILVRRAHDSLREKGAFMLDAPVSGGVSGAGAGALTIQVGGDPDVLDRVRPILEVVAKSIVHAGAIGAGCICKIAHNSAVFAANLAMIECMTTAIKAGVDANTIIELFQKSGIGRNHDLQVSLPVTLFRGDFEPRFAMATALKDIRLATELARAVGVPTPTIDLCEAEMREAVERGWGGRDHAVYLTLQERRAGVEVRRKPVADDSA